VKRNGGEPIVPGGVDEYIASQPALVQERLKQIRALIVSCARNSIETVSYFQIPGYSLPHYDYNGMFAWFSFVSFPVKKELPEELILSLVKASLLEMTGVK